MVLWKVNGTPMGNAVNGEFEVGICLVYQFYLDFYSHLLGKSQANGCLANLLGKMMINHGMGSVFFPNKSEKY